jgi:hypothetical protein
MSGLAGFDFQSLAQQALNLPGPFNMAADYGVSIRNARSVTAWRCILAYHLTPDENANRHCIFIECLDEQGRRTREPVINWYANQDTPMQSAPLDGVDSLPAAIIKLRSYDTVSVRINDGTPNIDSGTGIDYGHHSFFLVFQRQGVMMPDQPAVKPVVKTPAPLTLEQRIAELERWRKELEGDGR